MARYFLLVMASCPASDDEYWYYNDSADSPDQLNSLDCFGNVQRTPRANTTLLNTLPASPKPPCNSDGGNEGGRILEIMDNSDPGLARSGGATKRAPQSRKHNQKNRR